MSGSATRAAAADVCTGPYNPTVNPGNFTDPQGRPNAINNKYLPWKPGTRFTYQGTKGNQAQRDVVEVTRQTKAIVGVPTTVVRDTVFLDGRLAEDTFDWYAQDDQSNVWYFGEDSKEFDKNGHVSSVESWEAGRHGGKPGVIMKATPKVGDSHRQEFAPKVAEDVAAVVSLSKHVTVPFGSFNALQTRERSCIEPDQEFKYFAPGIGEIQEASFTGESERLELVKVETR